MRLPSQTVPSRHLSTALLTLFRGCCVALLVGGSGCGGGSGGAPSTSLPAQDVPQPAPAQLVVGTALSIDNGASGDPFILRVARNASGDGFAVWLAVADDGSAKLWANRYRAATAAWATPVNIASSPEINDLDLAVDPSGNAVVVWHEFPAPPVPPEFGRSMVRRFDAGAGMWTTPLVLNANSYLPRVAADTSGAVLAVYTVLPSAGSASDLLSVRGRFLDPVSGTWQPEAVIGQDPADIVQHNDPVAVLDGSGNALVAFVIANGTERTTAPGGTYHSRSSGSWGLGAVVPGSLVSLPVAIQGGLDGGRMELAASTDGNFLLAWSAVDFTGTTTENLFSADIRIARFTSRTQTWSAAQTVVSGNAQQDVQLQRMRSDAFGNAHLLWTENDGLRTALKALRLDHAGAACDAMQVIDQAVGRNAWRSDLAVDPLGNAIAIWQQFEGNLPDQGGPEDRSRSNIAINRFGRATSTWASAVLAETLPGDATSPRASAAGGQALLGWIQSEDGVNRVKALLQPLTDTPGQ